MDEISPEAPSSPPEAETPPRPWPVLSREVVADYEMFRAGRLRVRSPLDGRAHTFHFCDSPPGVTVVALTEDDEVVLVEQYRHPLGRVTLETPAGVMDDGEDPVEAGLRELREETGFQAASAAYLGCLVLNPSWQTGRLHVVVARGAALTAGKEEDATEDTRVRLVPLAHARQLAAAGEIDSATVVSALALHAWA